MPFESPFDFSFESLWEDLVPLEGSAIPEFGDDYVPYDPDFAHYMEAVGGDWTETDIDWGEDLYDVESMVGLEGLGSEEFMRRMAYAGFGLDVPLEIVDQFIEGMGGVEWLAPEEGLTTDLEYLFEQMELQETAMWEGYETWEAGQLGIAESQLGQLHGEYGEHQEAIDLQQKSAEHQLRGQRADVLRAGTQAMKTASSAAGRTGLVGGSAYKELGVGDSTIQEQLRGITLGERNVESTFESQRGKLEEGYNLASYNIQNQFGTQQQQRLQDIYSQLDMMQSAFEAGAYNIYDDWFTDLVVGITPLAGSGFETTEGEEWIWDPFGSGGLYEEDASVEVPGDI